jgi:hypothetical protein
MENIGKIVTETWSFLIEPVIATALGLIIIYYLASDRVSGIIARFPVPNRISGENNNILKLLDAYGLTKLIPIASIIFIVFALHAANITLRMIGDILPGHIYYKPDSIILHVTGRELYDLWEKNHHINSPKEVAEYAQQVIEISKSKNPSSLGQDSNHWKDNVSHNYYCFALSKVYLAIGIVVTIIRLRDTGKRRRTLRRFIVILLLCSFTGIFYMYSIIYSLEQKAMADIGVLRGDLYNNPGAIMVKEDSPPTDYTYGLREETFRDRQLHAACNEADKSWWEFKFFGSNDFIKWIRRTTFG